MGGYAMSANAELHNIAYRARNLLRCEAASLLLGCSDPALRHPLLNQFALNSHHQSRCYGSPDLISLLRDERIRALCDIAIQTARVQSLNHLHNRTGNIAVQSIAIAPLERPVGLLGLLLLVNPHAGAFHIGECLLLSSYAQTAAQRLEEDLQKPSHPLPSSKATSATNNASQAIMHNACNNAQQREVDRLKNEFVSMVSHELRTPLTAIKGYAGLLQAYSVSDRLNLSLSGAKDRSESKSGTGEITPARQQQYLDIIMEQANHLEVLIGDLLDVSRIQAGRLALRYCNVNLAQLCQQVVQVAQHRLEQKQAEKYHIRCKLAPNLPLVWADPDRVRQVLTNLLENAIKYSPDGGLIEVLANAHPGSYSNQAPGISTSIPQTPEPSSHKPCMVHITVRDSGIGIPKEQQSLLFQPFNRLEHPSTDHIPGTGLGLYITRKILEAMGGNITLLSSEGHGTSVTFTLPLAPLNEPLPQAESICVGAGVE